MDMTCDKWGKMDDIDPDKLIATLSMVCPLTPKDKQALLEARAFEKRVSLLTAMMEVAIEIDNAQHQH